MVDWLIEVGTFVIDCRLWLSVCFHYSYTVYAAVIVVISCLSLTVQVRFCSYIPYFQLHLHYHLYVICYIFIFHFYFCIPYSYVCTSSFFIHLFIFLFHILRLGQVFQTWREQNALQKRVQDYDTVQVLKADGSVHSVPSEILVPGDIVVIPDNGGKIVYDAVLLSGNCIINESSLTGKRSNWIL